MVGGETLWKTLQKGRSCFTKKHLEDLSLYIYFAQLRHHRENSDSIDTKTTVCII